MTSARLSLTASLLLMCPALANAQEGPGCGPANVTFDVSTKKVQQPAPVPASEKAVVYFLQDDLRYNATPRPTTRFGVDGTWVGATHANSYFYVSVDPGEHHLCANWQSDVTPFHFGVPKRSTAATDFTAEAGKIYYFRAQDSVLVGHSGEIISDPEVRLSPLGGDEAQVIINSFSLSSSHPKK